MKSIRGTVERRRCGFSGIGLGAISLLVLFVGVPAAHGQWLDTGWVQNGSFEANGLPVGWPHYTGTVSNWALTGSHMINSDASGPFHEVAHLGSVPHGTYVAGTQGAGTFAQNIPGLVDGQYYRLDLYINERNGGGVMDVRIWMGSQVLYGPVQYTPSNPYVFRQIQFLYDSAWGNTLTLESLSPTGDATILFDDVRIYRPQSYTVGYAENPGAGGSASGPASINRSGLPGGSITVNVTPNVGYSVASVVASNGTISPQGGNNYTLFGVTANTTVTGNFSANTYTVTFNEQGGSAPSPASKVVTYNAAYGTLATTSRTGYTFGGWYTAPTGGSLVTAGTTVTTASNHTLFAQWTANTYTVNFNAQGGSAPSPASKPVTYDDPYGTLATTSRTGYTFDGWYTAPTGGSQVTSGTTVATASTHTLYAQWTANTYTVNFNPQGGTGPSPTSKIVTYDDPYGGLATTSRTGYTFDGWFTAPTGGSLVTSGTTVATASVHTLYAQWTANTYTVDFNAQGGAAPSPPSKIVTYDDPYGTLATTSRTGYTFDGWFTAPAAGSLVIAGTPVTTASSHTLFAQWTANTYTVDFDEQGGGAPSPASKLVTYDDPYGTLATTSRTGYSLDGWFTAPTGGTPITAGTIVSALSNHTLYAQWTANTYTVVFDAQGGSAPTPASKLVTYDDPYGTLAATSRSGYHFDGWFTAPTGGSLVTPGTTVSTASGHTVYAQWTANPYTVTFDEQGGSAPSPASKMVTFDAAYGTLSTTSRTGYTFDGWYTLPTGGTLVTAGTIVSTAADHTVYAQWTANTYTVTFDAQGGSAPSPASTLAIYDAAYGALATTTYTGFVFDGWYTASTGGTLVTAATVLTTASDHTLYAQWAQNAYTVDYVADPAGGGAVSGPASIKHDGTPGDAITVTVAPNAGWSLSDVSATNGSIVLLSGDDYTLSGVTASTTVTGTFVEDAEEGEPACELAVAESQTANIGDDLCLEVANVCNAVAGDFTWTFVPMGGPGQTIPDESNAQLCLTDIQLDAAGTYTAVFENGATKAMATYSVDLTVVGTTPVSGIFGLAIGAGMLALGGARALRRRRH